MRYKSLLIGLIIGLMLGLSFLYVLGGRYVVKTVGTPHILIQYDTWTGKTWKENIYSSSSQKKWSWRRYA